MFLCSGIHWQPGQVIPMRVCESPIPEYPLSTSTPTHPEPAVSPTQQPLNMDILDILHKFQSSVETQLTSVVSGLNGITDRMTQLESQQRMLENASKVSVHVSSGSPRKGKRKGDVPTA